MRGALVFFIVCSCATQKELAPPTWNDLGVDDTVVTSDGSIEYDVAMTLVKERVPQVAVLSFRGRSQGDAFARFRLEPSLGRLTGGTVSFVAQGDQWRIGELLFAIGDIVIGENVDVEAAARVIDLARGREHAVARLESIDLNDDGHYLLGYRDDNGGQGGFLCICDWTVVVELKDNGTLSELARHDGMCAIVDVDQ